MVTLLNIMGVGFAALGCLLWLIGRLDSGLLSWIAGAVFMAGAGIIDELQSRLARIEAPMPMRGPGDKPPPIKK